jgi:hypothetical protein
MKLHPRAFGWMLGTLALLAVGSACAALSPRAIVIGDVTIEGTKRPLPTKEVPVYYLPVIAGYGERGAVMDGTKPPAEAEVVEAVVKALAQEHYLLMKPGSTPDLMLVIWWGRINPLIDEMPQNEGEVAPTRVFINTREMMALVGAFKADAFFKFDPDQLREAARDDRYFLLIGAFDFAAMARKEKKLLWSARMSTESTGRSPDEIFPLLAASGAAVFGRDTAPALLDTSPPAKTPKVELGPLEFIEVLPEEKKR